MLKGIHGRRGNHVERSAGFAGEVCFDSQKMLTLKVPKLMRQVSGGMLFLKFVSVRSATREQAISEASKLTRCLKHVSSSFLRLLNFHISHGHTF